MTTRAAREWQPGIADQTTRVRRVTARAQHITMLTRERIARLRVIECLAVEARGLPIRRGVALRTVRSKAALVLVLVAGPTRS